MFEEGVEMLLTGDASLEVRGVPCDDEAIFLRDVSTIFPDVIVMSETGSSDCMRVFDLIGSIQNSTPITIVVIRLKTRTVDVYAKVTAVANRSEDILKLVRDHAPAA